jgi:hypothetical protein
LIDKIQFIKIMNPKIQSVLEEEVNNE